MENIHKNKESWFKAIYDAAHKAGMLAAKECTPTSMVVQQHANQMDDNSPVVQQWHVPQGVCGFAWVNIKPGTSAFAKWMKEMKYADRDSYYGGVTVWVHVGGQSMEIKEAYAGAFAGVLVDHGINATSNSRMD